VSPRLALVLGNGQYASELYSLIPRSENCLVVTLLPNGLTTITQNVDFYGSVFELDNIIRFLREGEIARVVFGGDLGIYSKTSKIAKELIFGGKLIRFSNLSYIFHHFREISIVTLLQFAERRLQENGIYPTLASELLPHLKPRCGILNEGNIVEPPERIQSLAQRALSAISSQPRLLVRQVVAFDADHIIGVERESTDELLRRVSRIRKREGAVRTLVKLCPPQIRPTMDAPVIGPYTIDHCAAAKVDILIVDCQVGIVTQLKETMDRAIHHRITIIGYPQ